MIRLVSAPTGVHILVAEDITCQNFLTIRWRFHDKNTISLTKQIYEISDTVAASTHSRSDQLLSVSTFFIE